MCRGLFRKRLQRFLDEHPSIESGTSRIRVKTLANAAFELELWVYLKTGDWTQLTTIRQGILLDIAQIVEHAGAHFAAHAFDLSVYGHRGTTTEGENCYVE